MLNPNIRFLKFKFGSDDDIYYPGYYDFIFDSSNISVVTSIISSKRDLASWYR